MGPDDPPSGRSGLPVPEDVYGSWSPAPAPDGSAVAFVSDRAGSAQVWMFDGRTCRGPLADRLSGVKAVSWSPGGSWLACVTAAEHGSREQVWTFRPDGTDLRVVGGGPGGTAAVGAGPWGGWSADGRLLTTETVVTSQASRWTTRAFAVDPEDGDRQLVAELPLIALLDMSVDGTVALLRGGRRGRRQLGVVNVAECTVSWLLGGAGSTERGCLSPDGRTVFACTDVGREMAALVAVDLENLAEEPRRDEELLRHEETLAGMFASSPGVSVLVEEVAAGIEAGIEDVVPDPGRTRLALLWNVKGGQSRVSVLDVASGAHNVAPELPRDVVLDCRFSAGGSLLVTAESWSDPRGVWSVDGALVHSVPLSSPGSGSLLASRGASVRSVDPARLVPPELVTLASFDGTELTGWLYRPPVEPPWTTVIHLHGGPESQERPVYNSLFQSLISENVAVFAPNVRGSSGFGRSFRESDDLAGRYCAIDDVASCAAHLLASGLSVGGRMGCMGRSYGGYLTLAVLVRYPRLFSVGVDVCGMANFATFFAGTEPWIADAAVGKYGDPRRDAELLEDLSPIRRIGMLEAPLLVVHGAEDTNVPVCEAQQVVESLERNGVEHEYLLFPDEGHELEKTINRVAFVRAVVSWVTSHIGAPETVQL
ncbi:MAG: prolyl oligopeptidase family serine peptidase [Actinomycetota bacterium]|nr:prolyl oligopeptidase family serine peptidase [Actinomycetota bacterium]